MSDKSKIHEKLAIVEANQHKLITDLEKCNKDKLGLVEVIHNLERQLQGWGHKPTPRPLPSDDGESKK